MNVYLMIFTIFTILSQVSSTNYILPFKTTNIGINQALLEEDFLSNILSRRICSNLLIGSNHEKIKVVLNMSQIGFYIYNKSYDFNTSTTFRYSKSQRSFYLKNGEKGYDSNDSLCLIEYEKNKDINDYDSEKCNNYNVVKFELLESEQNSIKYNYYDEYGIIGLGANNNQEEYIVSTFMTSLNKAKIINSYSFSFNYIRKEVENINNEGYLLLGEEELDESKGVKYNVFSSPINGQLFWNIKCSKIYTAVYNISNSSIFDSYKEFDIKIAELICDLPYIIGIKQYKLYITAEFFQDLVKNDICSLKKIKLDEDYSTFVCDNTSKLFRDKFENSFPILKFQHYEMNTTFVLDKDDLFTYNYLNKFDTNIYFLVLFSDKKGKYNPYNPSQNEIQRWKLGIPFFKKYKLIFNSDSKIISYYEPLSPSDIPTDTDNPIDSDIPTDTPTDSDKPIDSDIPTDSDTPSGTDRPSDIVNPTDSDNSKNITDVIKDEDEDDNQNKNKKNDGNNNSNNNILLYIGIDGGGILFVIIVTILFWKKILRCPNCKKNEIGDEDFPLNSNESDGRVESLNSCDDPN